MMGRNQEILLLIASLTPGKTLSTTSLQILDYRSWTTSFWRRYQGENRQETFRFICETINQAMEEFEAHPTLEQKQELERALDGVATLTITYQHDTALAEEIKFFQQSNQLTVRNIWDNHQLQLENAKKESLCPWQSSPPAHTSLALSYAITPSGPIDPSVPETHLIQIAARLRNWIVSDNSESE